jgi:hypothetical protein
MRTAGSQERGPCCYQRQVCLSLSLSLSLSLKAFLPVKESLFLLQSFWPGFSSLVSPYGPTSKGDLKNPHLQRPIWVDGRNTVGCCLVLWGSNFHPSATQPLALHLTPWLRLIIAQFTILSDVTPLHNKGASVCCPVGAPHLDWPHFYAFEAELWTPRKRGSARLSSKQTHQTRRHALCLFLFLGIHSTSLLTNYTF